MVMLKAFMRKKVLTLFFLLSLSFPLLPLIYLLHQPPCYYPFTFKSFSFFLFINLQHYLRPLLPSQQNSSSNKYNMPIALTPTIQRNRAAKQTQRLSCFCSICCKELYPDEKH